MGIDSKERNTQVEHFISERLSRLGLLAETGVCRCATIRNSLEEILDCPVCMERVRGSVLQCHRGHVMCLGCYSRLVRCPVCRITLGPRPIRNRALETLERAVRDIPPGLLSS